jgi:carbon-monoxide dehydrogenase large subunit
MTAGLTAGRFVGQSVKRKEDARLVTGHGRYVDDVTVPGLLHCAFLRSDLARARITHLDVAAARALDGVHAVLTAADLKQQLKGDMVPTMLADGDRGAGAPLRPLADGDVRFVGDPIALVVADTRYVAEDAVDLIDVEYEPLPAVVDFEAAADDTDNIVHPELGSNVAATMAVPNPELDSILESAAHVVTETFWQHRATPTPMETRGIVASWDRFGQRLQVWMSSQNPHEVKLVCSRILGIPANQVRVTQEDVGGGFGQKFFMPREEMTIVLAAHLLGRPIKWIEDRRENLIASNHARVDKGTVTMAVDAEGTILGAKLEHLEDAGAYPVGGPSIGAFVGMLLPGPYRMGAVSWSSTAVWTNTCGRGAYRGPWMFETVVREQMMDVVARAIGMDPVEFRRRNVVHRAELPTTSSTGLPYDHMSPEETLEQAVELIGYDDFRAVQAAAREEGRYLGLGVGLYVEPQTGMGPLGVEAAVVRVDVNGTVNVHVGSGSHGQSLETTVAQVVAEHLGVHVDDVIVHQGDTDASPFGGGTGGSRSAGILSTAAAQASTEVRDKALLIGAHLLEAAPEDLELVDGAISVKGTPAKSVGLAQVAATAYMNTDALPPGIEPGLEVVSRFKAPPLMWSNACHVCTCEVDIQTGKVMLGRYVVSEDCGVMINPMVVEGQVAGGVAQGVGGVLFEHAVYDDEGNPLATTFLDYLLPTAAEVPTIEYGHIETPAFTPGGHKGMGEGGAIGSVPAVFNAVADALAPLGVHLQRQPLTPSALLDAIDTVPASS